MRVVVRENEGEDGILHEVVERAAGQFVQFHEVLKVSDLSLLPAGRDLLQLLSFGLSRVHQVGRLQLEKVGVKLVAGL